MTTLPKPIMRDDTEHGRKYCTMATAIAYGAACAADATERAAAIVHANAMQCDGVTREILLSNADAIRGGERAA